MAGGGERGMLFVEISGIPLSFGARDLRFYFTSYVEREKFALFHFKKRALHSPKTKTLYSKTECVEMKTKDEKPTSSKEKKGEKREEEKKVSNDASKQKKKEKCNCCLIQLKKEADIEPFLANRFVCLLKNFKHSQGNNKNEKCYIDLVSSKDSLSLLCTLSVLRYKSEDGVTLAKSDDIWTWMSELRPPSFISNGNVGTPTKVIIRNYRKGMVPNGLLQMLNIHSQSIHFSDNPISDGRYHSSRYYHCARKQHVQ
ncbi:hypothetical protein RFI_06503, partial [Reticulomyxa filosa]